MRAQCEQGVVAQPGWAPSDGGLWRKGDNEAERDSSNSDVHAVPLLGESGGDDGEGQANASQAQKFVTELMEVVIENSRPVAVVEAGVRRVRFDEGRNEIRSYVVPEPKGCPSGSSATFETTRGATYGTARGI